MAWPAPILILLLLFLLLLVLILLFLLIFLLFPPSHPQPLAPRAQGRGEQVIRTFS
jgi:hypothetical protein